LAHQPNYGYLPEPRVPATTHSGQWGLASLLMSIVILLLVPIFLMVFFVGTNLAWSNPHFDAAAMRLAYIGSMVIVFSLVGLGLLAFLFGIIGMISGMVRGQPGGLSIGGTLTSLVAMVLAIILMLATFRLVEDLRKHVDQRPRGGERKKP
jgi:hypothetical protein